MRKLFAALLLLVCQTAYAGSMTFTDLRAYDGDTFVSSYVPIPGLPAVRLRLIGIDTPEMRGKCDVEYVLAAKARNFLQSEVEGKPITVDFVKWDKYGGRVLIRARNAAGEDLTRKMIEAGHGYAYGGGFKRSWCNK
jgi:endonuclease YncB( thermonuclease family)